MRSLVENYFVSTQPAGWRCSDCGLVFRSRHQQNGDPPPDVLSRFERHSCKAYRTQHTLQVIVSKYKASAGKSQERQEHTEAVIHGATKRAEISTCAVETSWELIVKARESIETSKRRKKKTS